MLTVNIFDRQCTKNQMLSQVNVQLQILLNGEKSVSNVRSPLRVWRIGGQVADRIVYNAAVLIVSVDFR